jgi:hypothetical protein
VPSTPRQPTPPVHRGSPTAATPSKTLLTLFKTLLTLLQKGLTSRGSSLGGRAHTDGDVFIYLPKEKVIATGDALVDWMPFLGDGYPEDWIQTLHALEQVDFTHIIPGHGDVVTKERVAFLRGYLTDLIAAVQHAAAAGASLEEMTSTVADQLAPQYEQGMSKYPMGQYRDRIGTNVEAVYRKVVNQLSAER